MFKNQQQCVFLVEASITFVTCLSFSSRFDKTIFEEVDQL